MSSYLPFISIVVPTRNRRLLLIDCVISISAQEYPSDLFEVVVVDDRSSDGTADEISRLRQSTGQLNLSCLLSNGRGLNVARNVGLSSVRGDLVAFLDDDVVAPPTWLKALAMGSLRHSNAGCFSCPVRLRFEGKSPRLCGRDHLAETELDLGQVEGPVDAIAGTNRTPAYSVVGANMSIRRSAVRRVGPFNEDLSGIGDETEWVMRFLQAGGEIVYLPDAWVWHRRTAQDLAMLRLIRRRFRQGREAVAFARLVGQPISLLKEVREIPRFVAHAIRRRCAAGILSASLRAGRAWAILGARRP